MNKCISCGKRFFAFQGKQWKSEKFHTEWNNQLLCANCYVWASSSENLREQLKDNEKRPAAADWKSCGYCGFATKTSMLLRSVEKQDLFDWGFGNISGTGTVEHQYTHKLTCSKFGFDVTPPNNLAENCSSYITHADYEKKCLSGEMDKEKQATQINLDFSSLKEVKTDCAMILSLTLACLLIICIFNVPPVSGAPKVATPTINPAGGVYSSPQYVTITCSTIGAVTRYTTDGTEPTMDSNVYFGVIIVDKTMTLKAKAFMAGVEASDTATAVYTILAKVDTPTFSPPGGTYSSNQNVKLSCSTPNATLRYTTDGSEPSLNSTVYSNPILVNSNVTLSAKAFLAGINASDTTVAVYAILIPTVATPTFSPEAGTYISYATVTISCSTVGATIRYTTDGSEPSTSSTTYLAPVFVNSSMTLKAKAFMTGMDDSDTATAVYTITIPKVATPTFTPGAGTYPTTQSVSLSCITTGATIRYTVDGSNPNSSSTVYSTPFTVATNMTIKARAFAAGWTDSDTASAAYQIVILPSPKVATPTFNPPPGTYSSNQNVAITCATSGATIRYTIDGSEPSSTSTTYSSSISVSSTTTIKAKAFMTSMQDSDTATATYTINLGPKIATPTFSPANGSYFDAQYVTIQCDTPGATIRYTIFGGEPTSSSLLYSGPILISVNTVLSAKAFLPGMTDSDTAYAAYTIGPVEETADETPPEGLLTFAVLTVVVIIGMVVGALMASKD